MTNLNIATKKWIWNTWEEYPPDWFITILWNDLPTSPITSASHTRHLRNKILCSSCGVNRCSQIPEFPNRLGLTCFQERTTTQKGLVTFHTHIHLFNCSARGSAIISDPEPLWNSPEQLHHHIRYELGQSIDKMLKTTSLGNEGVVVKRWKEEHHRYYNLKEMERQKKMVLTRYVQDHDLLLDVENSDLLPIMSNGNGSSRHQRLSTATH